MPPASDHEVDRTSTATASQTAIAAARLTRHAVALRQHHVDEAHEDRRGVDRQARERASAMKAASWSSARKT